MRVLFVNHTSDVSGGERSLLELLEGLPSRVSPVVACPEGPLAEALRARSIGFVPIPGTEGSLRPHPYHTPRALADIARAGQGVRLATRRVGADLVHANSIRAGLVASAARPRCRVPLVTHVRDCLPGGLLATATRRLLGSASSMIVANSAYTARSFAIPGGTADIRVVHSPIDLSRFDPGALGIERARQRLGLDSPGPILGVVAQLTPWKGQDDAISAVDILRRRHPGVRLLLVGSAKFAARATRYDNVGYVRRLREIVKSLGLEREVLFLGERMDVPEVLRALDLLLVPSWEEPFGRSIIEGMAMEIPVLATSEGGPPEILGSGTGGVLVPPRRPEAWASAADALLVDPAATRRMAVRGRERVLERFGVRAHVAGVLSTWEKALRTRGTHAPSADEKT